jgi:hypothetical protein
VLWIQNLGSRGTFSLRRLKLAYTNVDIFGLMQAAGIGVLRTLVLSLRLHHPQTVLDKYI